jgi:amino acid transporter
MNPDVTVTTVAHGIQLAVAPVFLLTGIGAMLGVLTNRLSRIIDRGRVLESMRPKARNAQHREIEGELATLAQRRHYVNWAITLCTTCALLICIVIVTLFAGAFLDWEVTRPIGILFIVAMLVFIGGLLSFLREIYLASSSPHFLRS